VCLVGESGSGKTHLSYLWALRQNAEIIYSSKNNVFNTWYNISSSEDPQRYFVLDDADQLNDDILLFYIYNTIKEKDCYLLMTAKSHPNRWGLSLSDIKSRVSTINVINIKKPNDEAIVSMIEKMLLQRGISIKENVAKYISQRIERSYNSINNCVKQLDNKITDRKSKLSIQSVKEIL
jgi:chromosomal replication initiation ATPase DnaA